MAQIVFVDTANFKTSRDESVEVHSPTCQHMERYRKHPLFQNEADITEEFASAQSAFDCYNTDFYDEDPSGIWNIAFFPCSGLVKETTVLDSMSY